MAAATSAGAHDCQCRYSGQKYDQGATVCMRGKIVECGMYLNNASWNIVAEVCPQVRAPHAPQPPQPRQFATSLAISPVAAARRR